MEYVGIDVASAHLDAHYLGVDKRVPNTRQGFGTLLRWATQLAEGQPLNFVMESTGPYGLEMGHYLDKAPGGPVAVVSALHVKRYIQSLGKRVKTDAQDARMLGQFGRERQPKPWVAEPQEVTSLNQLLGYREMLVAQR